MASQADDGPTYGIALSGGGHRATAFALGALLYICDAGLNLQVRTISSVSGGSLLNGFVATLGQPFNKMTSSDFEKHAARLAAFLAGSPGWWVVGVTSTAMVLAILVTMVAFANVNWLVCLAIFAGWIVLC